MESWFPTFRSFFSVSGSFRGWWPWYTTAGQRASLLRLIAVATEENLPLVPLVESWMEDERGVQRRRLRRLVKLLQSGRPLADAVEEIPGVLRDEDLLAIRFDAQSGTRTAAVRALLDERQDKAPSAGTRLRGSIAYFCVVVPLALLVISFTQVKIVPVLVKIMAEFGIAMPPVLAWSATSSRSTGIWWLGVGAIIVVALWLYATRSGRRIRQALFGRLSRSQRDLFAADVLQKIGIASAAGRPVPSALSTLARYHFDPATRHELLFVRNEVEQDADVWQSLAAVGMLSPAEVHLLDTSQRLGNRPWIIEQLVETKQRRAGRRLQRGAEFVMPLVVLLMALLVVFQALTVFEPLTRIISALL